MCQELYIYSSFLYIYIVPFSTVQIEIAVSVNINWIRKMFVEFYTNLILAEEKRKKIKRKLNIKLYTNVTHLV